jgi:exopolysaccharide biosynthesis polyprenyl glycosylphosphotransferase
MILYLLFQLTQNVNYNAVNLLIVGKGKRVAQFIDKIKNKPELGYSIYGIIDDEEYPEKKNGHLYKKINNIPIIGYLYNLDKILSNNPIDEVIFIVPRSRLHYMENVIHHICATYGIKVNIAVDLFDITIANAKLSEVDNLHMLTFDSNPAREWQLMVKRLVDITVSLIILSILIIPLLVVAAMIKLTSPGPVLFVQKRVGVNGKLFSLYKFRSMYKDADKKLKQVLDKNIMTGPVFKMKNDPRVTPVGRIIRKYSIDEFPQFFNVLAGHMSLVGPRPNLITEVKQYQPWQMRRLSMRPGITCLWQINGRSNTSFEYWMKKDLMYLDEWSLGLDFKILYKTVPVVLKATGAY